MKLLSIVFINASGCITHESQLLVALAAHTCGERASATPAIDIGQGLETQETCACHYWAAFSVSTLAHAMGKLIVERTRHHPERLRGQITNREEADARTIVRFIQRNSCAVRRRWASISLVRCMLLGPRRH